jgi:hypothetical protein
MSVNTPAPELLSSHEVEAASQGTEAETSIGRLIYGQEPAVDLALVDVSRTAQTIAILEAKVAGQNAGSFAISNASTVQSLVTMASDFAPAVSLRKPQVPTATRATVRLILETVTRASRDASELLDPRHAFDAIRFVLRFVGENVPPPSVVPLSDSGVQLEWHRNGIDFEATFTDEDDRGLYCRDLRSGARWALPLDVAALAPTKAVMARLAERPRAG